MSSANTTTTTTTTAAAVHLVTFGMNAKGGGVMEFVKDCNGSAQRAIEMWQSAAKYRKGELKCNRVCHKSSKLQQKGNRVQRKCKIWNGWKGRKVPPCTLQSATVLYHSGTAVYQSVMGVQPFSSDIQTTG